MVKALILLSLIASTAQATTMRQELVLETTGGAFGLGITYDTVTYHVSDFDIGDGMFKDEVSRYMDSILSDSVVYDGVFRWCRDASYWGDGDGWLAEIFFDNSAMSYYGNAYGLGNVGGRYTQPLTMISSYDAPVPVPEPATILLLSMGVVGIIRRTINASGI